MNRAWQPANEVGEGNLHPADSGRPGKRASTKKTRRRRTVGGTRRS
jgi:hypothetical protein